MDGFQEGAGEATSNGLDGMFMAAPRKEASRLVQFLRGALMDLLYYGAYRPAEYIAKRWAACRKSQRALLPRRSR